MPESLKKAVERRSLRTVLRSILMLDDTPHSIALGTAIGMFVGLTPTMGLQMLIVLTLAFATSRLFRFNKVAGCLAVYVTNPFTAIPVYWFEYRVGTWFVAGTVTYRDFVGLMHFDGWSEWTNAVKQMLLQVGSPLLLGSLIVSTAGSILTYPAMLCLIEKVRRSDRSESVSTPPAVESEVPVPPTRITS